MPSLWSGASIRLRVLAGHGPPSHPVGMFVVTEADAAAIRVVFEQHGEFAAAVELRRLFPGVLDNAEARECARATASGSPWPFRDVPPGRLLANGHRRCAHHPPPLPVPISPDSPAIAAPAVVSLQY